MTNVVYTFGDNYRLNVTLSQLTRDGQPVPLSTRPLHVLIYLVANRDRFITLDDLRRDVWKGEGGLSDGSLKSQINVVRKTIGHTKLNPLILTESNRGYTFIGRVDEVPTRAGRTTEFFDIERLEPPREIFIGRDDAVAEIEAAMARRGHRVALHGPHGVGKSLRALAFANDHRQDYGGRTWWIDAETVPNIRSGLVALGIRLGWVTSSEPEQTALPRVQQLLQAESTPILLIFDNAENDRKLDPYFPRTAAVHVIVTTNWPDWSRLAEPVEVVVWNAKAGAEYLVLRTGREDQRDTAEALWTALEGLPLAYEMAAAYCRRQKVDLIKYKSDFETAEASAIQLLGDDDLLPPDYPKSVVRAFNLSIDKISSAAKELIVHAAMLAAERIPVQLFSGGPENFDDNLAAMLTEGGFDSALRALLDFALIYHEPDSVIGTYAMRLHRLVRRVARSRLGSEAERADVQRTLVRRLAKIYGVIRFWTYGFVTVGLRR